MIAPAPSVTRVPRARGTIFHVTWSVLAIYLTEFVCFVVEDLLLWRNVKNTGLVFGGTLWARVCLVVGREKAIDIY